MKWCTFGETNDKRQIRGQCEWHYNLYIPSQCPRAVLVEEFRPNATFLQACGALSAVYWLHSAQPYDGLITVAESAEWSFQLVNVQHEHFSDALINSLEWRSRPKAFEACFHNNTRQPSTGFRHFQEIPQIMLHVLTSGVEFIASVDAFPLL